MAKKKVTPKTTEKTTPKIKAKAILKVEEKTVDRQSVQSKNQTKQSGV